MIKRKLALPVVALFAIAITCYALVLYGVLDVHESPFIEQKTAMQLSGSWYVWLIAHAMSSSFALLVGWLQYVKRIRAKNIAVHRLIGMLYTAAVAVGGATGLYLAFFANGGYVGMAGFGLLALVWLYTTGAGVYAIIARNERIDHSNWMLRSYALAFAAVTLRLYLPISMIVFGEEAFEIYYAAIAWLCWVPNLLFAEWLIRRKAAKRRQRQHPQNKPIGT